MTFQTRITIRGNGKAGELFRWLIEKWRVKIPEKGISYKKRMLRMETLTWEQACDLQRALIEEEKSCEIERQKKRAKYQEVISSGGIHA